MTDKTLQATEQATPVVGSGVESEAPKRAIRRSSAQSVSSQKGDNRKHPDGNLAATIATMSLAGFTNKQMAAALKLSEATLAEHYRYEIENGRVNTMTQVVQSLAQRAIGGSDTAAIFLAKARLGWTDRQSVELTGKDGGAIEISQKTEILNTVNGLLRKGITIDGEAEPLD